MTLAECLPITFDYKNTTGSSTDNKPFYKLFTFVGREVDMDDIFDQDSKTMEVSVSRPGLNYMDNLRSIGVTINETSGFVAYINEFGDIAGHIIDACYSLKDTFGQDINISVFMNEDEDYPEEIFPIIIFNLDEYPEDTYELMDSIREKYYRFFGGNSGYFRITTDFD